MIDKVEAARRQIECAIRLVAREDDDLAVHTLIMAAYTILEDLSKGTVLYESGLKPHLTAGDMLIVSADIPPQWTISMRLTRRPRLCPCARRIGGRKQVIRRDRLADRHRGR
jgi:hypothetical protein